MKRKKWSELEEQTLLSKYSDLLRSGTLSKLKTREKKFKPVADHVNAVHHLRDPATFPFKWSWRDVSIKVQNMRHQYLGVKQKIRVSPHHFNWKDGINHWENFLVYKDVFGDVQLDLKNKKKKDVDGFGNCDELGFEDEDEDDEDDDDDEEEEEEEEEEYEVDALGSIGIGVLELREAVGRREERRREREFRKEKEEMEVVREKRRRERELDLELELELRERRLRWEVEKRGRVERELEEERRRRKRVEERMEEEMMEWRERMVAMQVEHEKQMMQMQVDACQNQMQILGIMARLVCQFFGSGNDGLGGGLGALPPQVLQNLHDTGGGLGNVKPDANSPSEFI
ncbi:hypothetical protein TanjilG_29454 [Lupinus angustifolius]|uniref:Uncharacterized protein n=1 Tax=Lupinus angustifolius TaxID=3871 RepID=A0A4P1R5K8_LUPAN|nr:PREDICTED: uncharacterized protein KIAA1211 homolog [Lupinus angustifolius]OIW02678.1 hypothetical protein TanjilG_29454 [Lupinus angustifolius]